MHAFNVKMARVVEVKIVDQLNSHVKILRIKKNNQHMRQQQYF